MAGPSLSGGGVAACPADELLAAFAEGELASDARDRIEVHVAACRTCRALIAAAADEDAAPTLDERDVDAQTAQQTPMTPLADMLAIARKGEVLGKWRLLELLGAGGMGHVYAAEHVETGARVALKLLRSELSVEPSIVRRFVREPYTANRIDHPAFVRVVEDGTAPWGAPYFAMDLVESPTLRAVVQEHGPPSEERVRRIGARILEAVAAAHAAGVLHRDLKPDNITLTSDDDVRILDLGIARLEGGSEAQAAGLDNTTLTGQMLGTPTYMPPEQARAIRSEIDERVDIYAVGATLFFLATGARVRSGDSVLFDAMTKPVAPVRTLAPELSPALARILDRALAFEKDERYGSAVEMRDALVEEADPRTTGTSLPRRRLVAGAIGACAIAAVALLSSAEERTPSAPPPHGVASAILVAPAPLPSPVITPAAEAPDVPAARVTPSAAPSIVSPGASTTTPARPASSREGSRQASPAPAPPSSSTAPVLPKDMAENPYR